MSQSDFIDHFGARAAAYAAYRPTYPPTLFTYLADAAPARKLAWDCGTGSGQAAMALAGRFERVIGTDASAAQIAAAASHPQVRYLVAAAESSGLRDASVDLCTVAQALHWFNLEQFYAEVRRVLVPSGVLAVWTYSALNIDEETIDKHLQHFYSGTMAPTGRVSGGWWKVATALFPFLSKTSKHPPLPCMPIGRWTVCWATSGPGPQ